MTGIGRVYSHAMRNELSNAGPPRKECSLLEKKSGAPGTYFCDFADFSVSIFEEERNGCCLPRKEEGRVLDQIVQRF